MRRDLDESSGVSLFSKASTSTSTFKPMSNPSPPPSHLQDPLPPHKAQGEAQDREREGEAHKHGDHNLDIHQLRGNVGEEQEQTCRAHREPLKNTGDQTQNMDEKTSERMREGQQQPGGGGVESVRTMLHSRHVPVKPAENQNGNAQHHHAAAQSLQVCRLSEVSACSVSRLLYAHSDALIPAVPTHCCGEPALWNMEYEMYKEEEYGI